MKSKPYILYYAVALIIGVLLLIFSGDVNIFEYIVVAIGILIAVPSIAGLIMGFRGKKDETGMRVNRPWYMAAASIVGLIFGTLLICMPSFFYHFITYTLGIILIFAGIVQIIFIVSESRLGGGLSLGWYVMPWLTVIAGLVIILVGPDRIAQIATWLTGGFLVVYSINGLLSALSSHRHKARAITSSETPADSPDNGEL